MNSLYGMSIGFFFLGGGAGIGSVSEFLDTHIITGTGKPTDFKFGGYITGPFEQKPIINFEKRSVGRWVYPGTVQIFGFLHLRYG